MAQFPSTTSASGEWPLKKQKRAQQGGNWPYPQDPYFEYVTMLLHGDGTNAAQNNTFLDSSSAARSITRTGNPTQGTLSPYGSNWSNYFNGSSYLTTPSSTVFAFGTGDFTIEFWVYLTAYNAAAAHIIGPHTQGVGADWWLVINANATVKFNIGNGSAGDPTSTGTVPLNTWTHVAVVKNSGTYTIYLNGAASGTNTTATSIGCTRTVGIGAPNNGSTYQTTGYISNLRVVKGTAVYTSAFTPSTTPLAAITNTSLLTCRSNRFVDNSTNALALTVLGSTSVQVFSPFSPVLPYSTSTISGSLYTNTSGNVLSTAISSTFNVSSGQGAWTMECWAYPTSFNGYKGLFGNRTSSNTGWNATFETSGTGTAARFGFYNSGGGSTYTLGAQAVLMNQWNHLALSSDGTTISHYVNGVRTQTSTASLVYTTSADFYVAANKAAADEFFSGYMTDFRFVKGTQVYSGATYTVPTAPLTAITNTQMLCNYTNGAIYDNAMMNDLETVGNAQISTSVVKYGTGSLYFDGTGDWLTLPSLAILNQIGDFTHECWVYLTAYPSSMSTTIYGFETTNFLKLGISTTGQLLCDKSGVGVQITGSIMSLNTWYHVALVRSGSGTNNVTLYLNGTSAGQATGTNSVTVSGSGYIARRTDANNVSITGYIDDLRITNGYARYTANFTPPNSAFPNY